jgi:hypothetical protein
MSASDCLMLCFDDNHYTKVFVFYDSRNNVFEIRGKNKETETTSYHPFSFTCKSITSVHHFLSFYVSFSNTEYNICMYNYDHLPEFSHEVTFEFLESSQDVSYEIFAYEQCMNLTLKRGKKLLKMLKNIYNPY